MSSVAPGRPNPPSRPARSCWALAADSARAKRSLLSPVADRGTGEHRVGGQLAGAHPHQRLFLGKAPVLGELRHIGRDHEELIRRGPGEGQGVLAQSPLGEMPDHRSDLEAEEHRTDGRGPLTEQAPEVAERLLAAEVRRGQPVALGRLGGTGPGAGSWPSAASATSRGPGGSSRPAHRYAGQPASVGRDRHAGGLGDVELGHPGQLLERILWIGSTFASGVPRWPR